MPRSTKRSSDNAAVIALALKKTKEASARLIAKQSAEDKTSEPAMLRALPPALEIDAEIIVETPQQREKARVKAAKRKQEDALWSDYQKNPCEDARNALWVNYQPLVRYISERLKSKLPECIDVNDLMGSGNIGLQDAITKFDTDIGVRFETYCVPRIRGAILDSIRALDWVPRLIRNKGHQYARAVRELASELHREPREDEIAARMNLTYDEFNELQKELNVRAQISVESCSRENADERDLMRLEMLESKRDCEPTRDLQRDEIRTIAAKGLSDNERCVLQWYYFDGVSMKDIGKRLGLSESRICQIHSQVLDVLRKKFKAYEHSCSLE
ncbi:MAG: FliA/WhiG family RNA polymerase sigma factor [Planctomycetota bacterium]